MNMGERCNAGIEIATVAKLQIPKVKIALLSGSDGDVLRGFRDVLRKDVVSCCNAGIEIAGFAMRQYNVFL